jgi:hypothetical protein
VILDPDAQIQQAIGLLFATFKRIGSAWGTVRYFRTQGLLFPRRVRTGPHKGEVHWAPLLHNTMLRVLRNPRYAGAFCYGRTHSRTHPDGSLHLENIPQEQWPFLLREAHPGYITWEEFEANLHRLQQNRPVDARRSPPRSCAGRTRLAPGAGHLWAVWEPDDAALLPTQARNTPVSGISVSERVDRASWRPSLPCLVLGAGLDAAITDLLLAQLTPLALDTSVQVYEELHTQAEEARRLRAQQVERARYAAELAQRRFLQVDPENRLVASVLEADWNARLRELAQVQEEAERQNTAEQCRLTALEQQAIADLVNDFPRVWRDPRTSDRDRKRMVRRLDGRCDPASTPGGDYGSGALQRGIDRDDHRGGEPRAASPTPTPCAHRSAAGGLHRCRSR